MSKIAGMHNSTYKNDILGFMQSDHRSHASYTPQSTSLYFWSYVQGGQYIYDNNTSHTPSEDTDQLWHPPNRTRAFAVHVNKFKP